MNQKFSYFNQAFIKLCRFLFNISPSIFGPQSRKGQIKVHDQLISMRTKIRIYSPLNIQAKAKIVFYIHGGGFIVGSIKAYDRIAQNICYSADCVVVLIDYPLAPEHKFPEALNDLAQAYEWILDNIAKYSGDMTKIILAGDSAGGNLIVNLFDRLKLENQNVISLILIYPLLVTKLKSFKNPSLWFKGIITKITRIILNKCIREYYGEKTINQLSSGKMLPKLTNIASYPSTLIITAGYDALTLSINDFAAKLESQKVKLVIKNYPKALHGFINLNRASKSAQLALDEIINWIKKS